MRVFFVYARVARLALAGALRVRALVCTHECLASASASTRVLVHASSLSWGGGGGGGVESALSGRGENIFGRLGESAGARIRGRGEARRERGGAESLVARRL